MFFLQIVISVCLYYDVMFVTPYWDGLHVFIGLNETYEDGDKICAYIREMEEDDTKDMVVRSFIKRFSRKARIDQFFEEMKPEDVSLIKIQLKDFYESGDRYQLRLTEEQYQLRLVENPYQLRLADEFGTSETKFKVTFLFNEAKNYIIDLVSVDKENNIKNIKTISYLKFANKTYFTPIYWSLASSRTKNELKNSENFQRWLTKYSCDFKHFHFPLTKSQMNWFAPPDRLFDSCISS